jgi:hypothetical protein
VADPRSTGIAEVHGRVSTGRITMDHVAHIDLDVPFEIVGGRLEFTPLPTPWHQPKVRRVQVPLDGLHPTALRSMLRRRVSGAGRR